MLAMAASYTWDSGGGSGNVSTADAWNPNGTVLAADDITIDSTADSITWDSPTTVSNLTLNGSFTGTLTGAADTDLTVTNTLTLTTGTLATDAVITAATHSQGSSGTLSLALDSTTAGSYGRMNVTGTLTLAGTLTITESITEAAGQTFDILNWGLLSGEFDDIQLPNLSVGLAWDLSNLYVNGQIQIIAAPAGLAAAPVLWLDASDAGSVLKSGSNVLGLIDKVGTTRTISVSGNPTYTTGDAEFNSENTVAFDGNDYLEYADVAVGADQSVYIVAKVTTVVDNRDSLFSYDNTNDYQLDAAIGTQYRFALDSTSATSTTYSPVTDHQAEINIYGFIADSVSDLSYLYINGVSHDGGSISYTGAYDSTGDILLFTDRTRVTEPVGSFAEVLVYDSVHTEVERRKVEAYLGAKYNLKVPIHTSITAANTVDTTYDVGGAWNPESNYPSGIAVSKNGYEPVLGDTFDIIDFTSASGLASNIVLPTLSTGLAWDLSNLYVDGSISVIAAPAGLSDAPTLWLDASDKGSVFKTGSFVSGLADKTGATRSVITYSGDPSYTESNVEFNSLGTVEFDGDDYLLYPDVAVGADQSVYIVAKVTTVSDNRDSLFSYDNTNDYQLDAAIGTQYRFALDSTSATSTTYSPVTNHETEINLYGFVADSTNDLSYLYINGVSHDGGSISYTGAYDSTGDILLFTDRTRVTEPVGSFAEVLVYDSVHTEVERRKVEAYLGAKYNLKVPIHTSITAANTVDTTYDVGGAWNPESNYPSGIAVSKNGYEPVLGDTFDIIDFTSASGLASNIVLPTLSTGLAWDLSNLYVDGSISVIAAPAGLSDAPTLWLDASDKGSVFKTGSFVSGLADKTGATRSVITYSGDPSYTESNVEFNSLGTVEFDGDDYLLYPDVAVGADQSVYIVAKVTTVSDNRDSLFSYDNTNDYQLDAAIGTQYRFALDSTSATSTTYSPVTNHETEINLYGFVADSTNDLSYLYINGVSHDGGSISYTGAYDSTGDILLFTDRTRLTEPVGTFAEVLVYDSVHTDGQRQAVEAYIAQKYNLSGSFALSESMSFSGFTLTSSDTLTIDLDSTTDGCPSVDSSMRFNSRLYPQGLPGI